MSTLLQSYLFAWLFVLGVSLGSLANLMVQSLTGGRWVEPVRPAWIAAARLLPLVALLFLPVAFGVRWIYPWTDAPGRWLNIPFFVIRSAVYLAVWCFLAAAFLRAERGNVEPAAGGGSGARTLSAAGLIVYTFTISLAAFDWIASLTPSWYSSGFGLVVGTGQMLCAAAFGVASAALVAPAHPDPPMRQRFHDLGNLLLMYVLVWAYLAFTQFLVIWSENIPTEIHWYVGRLQTGWVALAWIVVALHFALPFAILLSRDAKRSPRLLGSIAAGLLGVHLVQVYWMVVPSVRPGGFSFAWSDGLVLLLLAAAGSAAWRRSRQAMAPAAIRHG